MIKKARKLFSEFLKIHFLFRYFGLTFAGAILGSSYIGFVSEIASYYYAWNMGFRIPAEGIPYLKITIISISFCAIIILASALIFINSIGRYIYWYTNDFKFMQKYSGRAFEPKIFHALPDFNTIKFKDAFFIAICGAIIVGLVYILSHCCPVNFHMSFI